MYIFYIDEAGCTGTLPSGTSNIQPVFALAGIIIQQSNLEDFTRDFLFLKRKFFRGLARENIEFLDWIKIEIKGSDLRKHIRESNRNRRRHALFFMGEILKLAEKYDVKIVGRVFIKPIGKRFYGRVVYTSSIQEFATDFQHFLTSKNENGLMILDSRNKPKNANVSHSIFTQKFRSSGDAYNRLWDMPLFGHSENHAAIQVADLICSAFIFPMATFAYCSGYVNSVHIHPKYQTIRNQFSGQLKQLQFRYLHQTWWRGGINTFDGISCRSSSLLFS